MKGTGYRRKHDTRRSPGTIGGVRSKNLGYTLAGSIVFNPGFIVYAQGARHRAGGARSIQVPLGSPAFRTRR